MRLTHTPGPPPLADLTADIAQVVASASIAQRLFLEGR